MHHPAIERERERDRQRDTEREREREREEREREREIVRKSSKESLPSSKKFSIKVSKGVFQNFQNHGKCEFFNFAKIKLR